MPAYGPKAGVLELALAFPLLEILGRWGFFHHHDITQSLVGVSGYLTSFAPLLCNGVVAACWPVRLG